MKIYLHSDQLPSGNSVDLAKTIKQAAGIGATESVQLAMELFGGKYNRCDRALELTLNNEDYFDKLAELCNQFGILIEIEK